MLIETPHRDKSRIKTPELRDSKSQYRLTPDSIKTSERSLERRRIEVFNEEEMGRKQLLEQFA
ncbi:MAG TPA: hypothetical protein VFN23_14080, partial [Ktedonobacteraceae bacterium]|nr:hypothetical protein [Ktedonobacteraceae bacterium]